MAVEYPARRPHDGHPAVADRGGGLSTDGRGATGGVADGRRSPADEDFSHIKAVSFERIVTVGDTSSVGFVYFSKFIDWQAECRETLGYEYLPDYMAGIDGEITMVTHSCSCQYLGELWPGDRVEIDLIVPWVRLEFMRGVYLYYRTTGGARQLVARGEQIWMSARRSGNTFGPGPWPQDVLALVRDRGGDVSRALVT